MSLIRGIYRDDKGKLHKAYKSHLNHNGFPLCGLCDRQVAPNEFKLQKWIIEDGEKPSCMYCKRIAKQNQEQVAGGAA